MPAVGLDISDNAVRFIELIPHGTSGILKVEKSGEKKFTKSAVVSGYIYNSDEVMRMLRGLKEEYGLNFVNVSIPEEKTYLFSTQIPRLNDEEARDAIELKLEENVPISAKEAVFDYLPVERENNLPNFMNVIVSVVPEKVALAYAKVVSGAGLTPLSFEIRAQAVAKSVVSRNNKKATILVNFGEFSTSLSIISLGIVMFTSTVPVGGKTITEAIGKQFNFSGGEAETFKEKGLPPDKKKQTEFLLAVVNSLSLLKDEIGKLVIFWQTHNEKFEGKPDGKINDIILCGSNAVLPGVIEEYLSEALGMRTELANVWGNLFSFDDYIPPIKFRDSLDYAAAIGLALD